MSEIRELIDTELEAVCWRLFDVGVNVRRSLPRRLLWLSAAPVSSPPVAALPVRTSVVY